MIDLKKLKKNQEVFVRITGKKGKVKSVRQVSGGDTLVTIQYPNGSTFMTEDPSVIDDKPQSVTPKDILRQIDPR